MNYTEVDITKGTNHFIIGAEGCFFSRKKKYVEVSLKKYFNLLYVKKNISLKTPTTKIVFKNIHSIKKDQKNLQEMYAVLI